jgi:hypothetical protein
LLASHPEHGELKKVKLQNDNSFMCKHFVQQVYRKERNTTSLSLQFELVTNLKKHSDEMYAFFGCNQIFESLHFFFCDNGGRGEVRGVRNQNEFVILLKLLTNCKFCQV